MRFGARKPSRTSCAGCVFACRRSRFIRSIAGRPSGCMPSPPRPLRCPAPKPYWISIAAPARSGCPWQSRPGKSSASRWSPKRSRMRFAMPRTTASKTRAFYARTRHRLPRSWNVKAYIRRSSLWIRRARAVTPPSSTPSPQWLPTA